MDWGAVGALAAPLMVAVTWMLSRRERRVTTETNSMSATAEAAASTVVTMQSLMAPMEQEIRALRLEIAVLRTHVTLLERQIKELGDDPIPPPIA